MRGRAFDEKIRDKIRQLDSQHVSTRAIAERLDVSMRRVQEIKAEKSANTYVAESEDKINDSAS